MEAAVEHARQFNLYNRGQQWDIARREVAKLNVRVRSLDGAAPLLGAPWC
ncbi:MAG: hypothetical protein JNL83_32675 [Myxococcales bacterium]|nr:hypothetical protein [Myxococcales bacterium]